MVPNANSCCTPAIRIPDCRTVDSVRASRRSPLTAAGAETAAAGAEAAGHSASASAAPERSADSADSRC